ncbi:DNA/RNA nuclease SfsA [Waltera intestinalis]|uniref:DNA/RNA nuclease SfsA n=1 Tax=Waltera intestinalis TaxID=2606635 RepID=UPI0012B3E221|nr:DNA/RNA nuclease SfsA [Waltera intestinalis]
MEYIKGTFLREQKTRFLCDVVVDNKDVECYIPVSCKISKLVDLTGKEVVLQPVENINARTKFSVYAARLGKYYVLLNLAEANRVLEAQLQRRYFSFLGKRKKIYREKVIEGYKTDLYIDDTNTLIEVKTLLSFDEEGKFPSMTSVRAEQQLEKLSELLDKGYKVIYIVMSLNPKVKSIVLNNDYGRYCQLFRACLDKGMKVKGFSIRLKDMRPEIYSRINFYEKQ